MRRNRLPIDANGVLLLLCFILSLHALKGLLNLSRSHGTSSGESVFVQISGDIPAPGVYGFPDRPDLTRLLLRSGTYGPLKEGRTTLRDCLLPSGAQIAVHRDSHGFRVSEGEMSAFYKATLGIPISINKESWEGLTAVQGIGPKIARALVSERTKRGGFKAVEEILSVEGVGPGLYAKIRSRLTL